MIAKRQRMMPSSMRLLHDGCECWTILPIARDPKVNKVTRKSESAENSHRLCAYLKLNQMKATAMPQPAKLRETMET